MIKMGKKYGHVQMLMAASAEVSELKEIRSHLEEDLYRKSGQTFSLGALPRLLWIKNMNQKSIVISTPLRC